MNCFVSSGVIYILGLLYILLPQRQQLIQDLSWVNPLVVDSLFNKPVHIGVDVAGRDMDEVKSLFELPEKFKSL
jgi:hypothetical protein